MLMTYFVNFRYLNDHLFGKELFIRFTASACGQFMYLVISLFGFEGRMWDLIVSVPDHCLSFYFSKDILVREQDSYFSEEMISLRNGKPVKRESRIAPSNPILDGGLIRSKKRLCVYDTC